MALFILSIFAFVFFFVIIWILIDKSYVKSFTDYPDDIRSAAYQWISPPSIRPSYLGGDVSQIADAKRYLADKRVASANIKNDDLRNCVLSWLDYHEGTWIVKEEKELQNRITKTELDEYKKKRIEHQAQVNAILAAEKIKSSSQRIWTRVFET